MKDLSLRRKGFIFAVIFFLFLLISLTRSWLLGQQNKPVFLQATADLPLKLSRLARPGDVLLSGPRLKVLFGGSERTIMTHANYAGGNAKGTIIGATPPEAEADGQVHVGVPVLRIKNRTYYGLYSDVKFPSNLEKGLATVEATGTFSNASGLKLKIQTSYIINLNEGRIDITSTITNAGQIASTNLAYSLLFDAFHSYNFSPFNESYHRQFNFRFYQKKNHCLAWLNLNPPARPETPVPGRLEPGQSFQVKYILLLDPFLDQLLEKIYQYYKVPVYRSSFILPSEYSGWKEVVVTHVLSGATFCRAILDSSTSLLEIPLPEDIYRLRAHLFPAVTEATFAVSKTRKTQVQLRLPLMGKIKLRLQDSQGNPVPGKVTLIGLQPTRTPYFRPENPVETGRSFERFKNSVFPPPEGLEAELPVGTYLASASHGPEWSLDQKVVEILADSAAEVVFLLDRVVEKPGLVSLDPHMHTLLSDGTVSISNRLRSLIAEGVEVAIATDHNVVTNYEPILRRLGWENELTVLAGTEVTVPDMLHFNVYPLIYREDEERKGAIEPVAEKVGSLFGASRAKSPGVLLQVNHPRAGTLGYFNNYELDLISAARVNESFNFGFDLLEVMNGASPLSSNAFALEDWLHLLNRGYFYPLVGSSDSHTIDGGEPGYARTYVLYKREKASPLDPKALLEAVKKGKAFASTGPFIELKINDSATFGDCLSLKPGPVNFKLRVWGPPWLQVDEVRIIFNGERCLILPLQGKIPSVVKMDEAFSWQMEKDTAVVAEVIGKKSLFPLLQQPSDSGLLRDAVLPYAITNPVFLDFDGNGKFDPPWPQRIEEVKSSTLPGPIIRR